MPDPEQLTEKHYELSQDQKRIVDTMGRNQEEKDVLTALWSESYVGASLLEALDKLAESVGDKSKVDSKTGVVWGALESALNKVRFLSQISPLRFEPNFIENLINESPAILQNELKFFQNMQDKYSKEGIVVILPPEKPKTIEIKPEDLPPKKPPIVIK